MGMGKTLQAIALLLQTKSEMGQYVEKELNDMVYNPINNNNADSTTTTTTSTDDSKHYPKVPTTLVVCPVVALAQVLFHFKLNDL
jgi:SNF2 family DNA or RNA helicase